MKPINNIIMNLAEQIKDKLRESNSFDSARLSAAAERIFTATPTACISIEPKSRYYEDPVNIGRLWFIEMPSEWFEDSIVWAEEQGFRIKKTYDQNGSIMDFCIHLF